MRRRRSAVRGLRAGSAASTASRSASTSWRRASKSAVGRGAGPAPFSAAAVRSFDDLVRGRGVGRAQPGLDLLQPRHARAGVARAGLGARGAGRRPLALALQRGRAVLQGGLVERRERRGRGQPALEGRDARLDARALAREGLGVALRAQLGQVEDDPGIAVADGRTRDLAAGDLELLRLERGHGRGQTARLQPVEVDDVGERAPDPPRPPSPAC